MTRAAFAIAFLIAAVLIVAVIERAAEQGARPQTEIAPGRIGSVNRVSADDAPLLPLSHPLRGPDCDATITQRSAGKWSPERCAKGVRK